MAEFGTVNQAVSYNATQPSSASRLGWVGSPNQRGTLNILWSCVSALFLCLWSMLHLNVPAQSDSFLTIICRKARWLCLGILAPELPMLFASGQRSSAVRSVERMRQLGFSQDDWTLTHGFFADGGGFVLHPRDSRPFPVSATQLAYLVQRKHIDLPRVSKKEIWDKSKADGMTKCIALLQTSWLMVQTMGRAAEDLPITPFELSSIAMTATALTTLLFWWDKPLDVNMPIIIHISHTTADILIDAGEPAKERWSDTPLDFVEPNAYMSSRWSRRLLILICRLGLQTRPMSRIPNDRDPQANGLKDHIILAVGTATFASIHLAGWNFEFDCYWEAWLWKASCLAVWGLLCIYGFSEVYICYHEKYAFKGLESGHSYKLRWPHCLLFFVPASLYVFARLGLLVVSLSSMRSLPAGAYDDVRWSSILPHF